MQDGDGTIWYLENALTDFSGAQPPQTRHGIPRLNMIDRIAVPAAEVFFNTPLAP